MGLWHVGKGTNFPPQRPCNPYWKSMGLWLGGKGLWRADLGLYIL